MLASYGTAKVGRGRYLSKIPGSSIKNPVWEKLAMPWVMYIR